MRTSWRTRSRVICVGASISISVLTAVGCSDAQYAFYAVTGQLAQNTRTIPVEDALAAGDLSAEQETTLLLVLDLRDYLVQELGLRVGESYTVYLDTADAPVAFNLSASAKDSLTPVVWTFPVVGSIPYLHFYHEPEAREYQDRLVAQGYDTVLYEVAAYSTAGLFADPITTGMLGQSELYLVDLIAHESTHNTVYRLNETQFNENVATFVASVATVRYLTDRYGADSDAVAEAHRWYHDLDLYNAFLADLYARAEALYAADIPATTKLASREVLFEDARRRFRDELLPQFHEPTDFEWVTTARFNNAWLLLNARYNQDLSIFQAVYDSVDQDFARALQIFHEAAASADPLAYLYSAVE
ncbi:MAG: aminopeptidase [Phycisphaerae bacterium]|nr:aminopeptidase [Phycisphaerae bacterium]